MKKIIKRIIVNIASFFLHNIVQVSLQNAKDNLEKFSPDPNSTCVANNEVDINYDLQIILPCYNVSKYIEECLDSILNQETSYSYIVTAVNDGSTDGTNKILEMYSKKYSNLEVINQKNRGLSGARNTALRKISGKYITFIDSDDILLPGAIETFMSECEGFDITQASWKLIDKESKFLKNIIRTELSGYAWGKIFNYKVLEKFQFPEGYLFEDTPVSLILYGIPNLRMNVIKEICYGYRINPNGITQTANATKRSVETYYITEKCLHEFTKFGVDYDKRAYNLFIQQCKQNYNRTRKMPIEIRKAIFVCESNLKELYFKDFFSEDKYFQRIEKSLDRKNFMKFELLCWAA